MPVPAGPIPNVMVRCGSRRRRLLRDRLRGDLLPSVAPDDVVEHLADVRRPSSAPSTASTVCAPIWWPPSTSSTSSSITSRASATCASSPSSVSWLPRRRIVHLRRSRSASSTPSPIAASSAATSFETSRVSCTVRSVGRGRSTQPRSNARRIPNAINTTPVMRSSVLRTRGRRMNADAWPTAIPYAASHPSVSTAKMTPRTSSGPKRRAVAVHELRQEAREEDGDLRVPEIAEQALANGPEAVTAPGRRAGRPRRAGRASAASGRRSRRDRSRRRS